jgi:hypothetical protein
MDIADYLASMPNLHTWDNGVTWNTGGFEAYHFGPLHEVIAEFVQPGPAFIETGAGNSTIFFLLHNPSKVVSIAPDAGLFDRIRSYCAEHGIPTDPLHALVDGSEWALPPIAKAGPAFDFALIDGDHSLERTVMDFFYLNHTLKKGGLLMIDDLHLHSAKEVVRLIQGEADFRPVFDLRKALVFQKTTDNPTLRAWSDQTYLMHETRQYELTLDRFKIDRLTPADLEDACNYRGDLGHYQAADYRAIKRL